eukprot:scaffold1490_cov162-Ochromonas_danica.AAC.51
MLEALTDLQDLSAELLWAGHDLRGQPAVHGAQRAQLVLIAGLLGLQRADGGLEVGAVVLQRDDGLLLLLRLLPQERQTTVQLVILLAHGLDVVDQVLARDVELVEQQQALLAELGEVHDARQLPIESLGVRSHEVSQGEVGDVADLHHLHDGPQAVQLGDGVFVQLGVVDGLQPCEGGLAQIIRSDAQTDLREVLEQRLDGVLVLLGVEQLLFADLAAQLRQTTQDV